LAETIAKQTGATLVELPAMAGGLPDTRDYISFVDHNVRTMVQAVKGGG
jgi:ABC-type Zn uptake system ZnuABC Zn-binding protein ZnuA